ncbi:MAG: arginine kinase [Bacteriovoracaceae bacterium]|nr:arginine kinase [Bacteriovoracaceae bacterium]
MSIKYLTDDLKNEFAGKKTQNGFTIDDVVRSGVENSDSSIGAYAADAESYQLFAPLFDKIIEEYHGYPKDGIHTSDLSTDKLLMDNLDPTDDIINSTRIRVGRNLASYAFAAAISLDDRQSVEKEVISALNDLTGELQGTYYSLEDMDEKTRLKLVADHFLFKKGDRFLESAGVNRDWPRGRGIFCTDNKRFLVWINEEDHLRIISMQNGGDILMVFKRLMNAINTLEKKLQFAYSGHLGNLSSCPTNLGTAMRASVHIKLPKLSKTPSFKDLCNDLKLSIRGIHGEHSESEGGVYDISNKQRLGVSENDVVYVLYNGIKRLIGEEAKL